MPSPLLPMLLWLLPQVVLPRPQDLVAARGDDVELQRLGCRLGPARLLRIAAQERAQAHRVAALTALGLCGAEDGVVAAQALGPLSELLSRTGDGPLLEAGVEAAQRLARRLGRGQLDGDERLGDELPRAAAALLRIAADRARPPEVRADLVEAATALPAPLWQPAALLPLCRGADAADEPARQAALLALQRSAAAGQQAELRTLVDDQDPAVAVPAAAALCEVLEVRAGIAERVRALAAPGGGAALGLRQRLQACLRHLGTPADKALLQGLLPGRRRTR